MAPVDLKAIEAIRDLLEKRFKDSAELFPDFTTAKVINVIPTSSAILNAITVVGGFPRGRVTEIFGPESTGKTTIAIEAAVAAQAAFPDLAVLYLDFEHALDVAYAHKLGLNLNPGRFIVAQPDSFEQGFEIVKSFLVDEKTQVSKNLLSLIVVDSAAAMTPKAELMGDVDAPGRLGLQAQLMSRFLASVTKWITKGTKPVLLVLNQTRTKIDLSNPRNTGQAAAGGNALKFYTTIRLSLEATRGEGEEGRSKDPSRGTDQVFKRHRVRVTAIKNKVAPPWVRGTLVFEFGTGINNLMSVAELAESKLGIMSGAGFFKYVGDTPETSFNCRGRELFIAALEKSPAILKELEKKVLAVIRVEHSKALGLADIKQGGAAKEVEGEVLLEDPSGMVIEEAN